MNTSHLPEVSNPKAEVQETYTAQKLDNGYIVQVMREQSVPCRKISISISWRSIIVAIVVLAIVIPCVGVAHDSKSQETAAYAITEPYNDANTGNASFEEVSIEARWKISGFLFPDSDKRILTEADILSLSDVEGYDEAELLRYAVNEIYARHHYSFSSEMFASFFRGYCWYDGYLSAEDACALFNSIEQQNLAFLLKAEEKHK